MTTHLLTDSLGPFAPGAVGAYYRGNLHLHSTRSDGRLDPPEVFAAYRAQGYDFVALTDHNRLPEDVATLEGLTLLPGAEVDYPSYRDPIRHWHFVAIGLDEVPEKRREFSRPGDLFAHLVRHSALAFCAHPHWSDLGTADLLALKAMEALEVYNHGCQTEVSRGESSFAWDGVLASGRRCLAVATDDAHRIRDDSFGGWVMVRADANTPEALLEALRAGRFYSSTGPRVASLEVDGERVTIRSAEPCREIRALANLPAYGANLGAATGHSGPVTELTYKLRGTERYLRFELVDSNGRIAWTNPIYFAPDA